ncbi:hypothetical protein QIU18_00530 [Capnocytophaga canimorsus]|nr:hypothetical protein [Capnocytophaga canimorsus]WGU68220.1 hypothetical protein QIU19_13290 [Capnocytophaga canimorsus]WGU70676.1 hypothetical protein QIU18_00530 [Capnocytophaga canimorsus]
MNTERKNLTPRFEEEIITTSDISQMRGKFLAKRLLRTWQEEFVDEDTGEAVTIERKELIMNKGTLLESDELSEINFFLQSGDIQEVEVSNIQRMGTFANGTGSLWVVTAETMNKNKNFYLGAKSVTQAQDIAIDYIEQNYDGVFHIVSVKSLPYVDLVSFSKAEPNDKEAFHYKIDVEITIELEDDQVSDKKRVHCQSVRCRRSKGIM